MSSASHYCSGPAGHRPPTTAALPRLINYVICLYIPTPTHISAVAFPSSQCLSELSQSTMKDTLENYTNDLLTPLIQDDLNVNFGVCRWPYSGHLTAVQAAVPVYIPVRPTVHWPPNSCAVPASVCTCQTDSSLAT